MLLLKLLLTNMFLFSIFAIYSHSIIHIRNSIKIGWALGGLNIPQTSISISEMQTAEGINSQLSIVRSDREDSGIYKCIAENPFGRSEHIIYLAVQG